MTLYDLQGKALYSGDKEVQKAYLGANVFYQLPPDFNPISYVGSPDYVIDFRNGQTNAYLTGTHTVAKFMQPTGANTPSHTTEGLVFAGSQYFMNKAATSFTRGMFEMKIKVDKDAIVREGNYIYTLLSIHEDGRSNRKRSIGIDSSGNIVFFSGYSTTRITGPSISGDELTIAMDWDASASSNNTLYVNGKLIGNSYISSDSYINTIGIGVSSSDPYYFYQGKFILQNIKYYTSANILTPEQVQQSYQTT